MKTVFMFPGQGAQKLSMGKALSQSVPLVADLYKKANDILGYDLAAICFDGPEDKLNTTEIAQPAIFVTSVAALEAMRAGQLGAEDGLADITPDACAGLSLGEYTALYAAGALDFENALKLVQLRGRSMQQAAEQRRGTMVSIMGLDEEGANKLCQAVMDKDIVEDDGLEPFVSPVNFNCPGQIVVSGSIKACGVAAEIAEEYGASRAIPLQVAGAFHTRMMEPAAQQLGAALDKCEFSDLACPVIANVDAKEYESTSAISGNLMKQLVGAVRWQQSVENLLDQGYDRFVEIGPARVLTGLVKKTTRAAKVKVTMLNANALG